MDYDDAYANGAHVSGAENYPPRWAAEAQAFRASLGARAELGLPYGDGERQVCDIFRPQGTARGTLIFIHGGYWRAFDRSTWSAFAAGAVARGWAVAMPSYDLCPAVRIADITRQIAQAVRMIAGVTEGPISIAGHSAGGQLIARMLDRALIPDGIAARFHRLVPISPLADLRPLIFTAMNDDFRMDAAAAVAESPVFMADRHDAKVTAWVGGAERPAFIDQARWLSEAWGCGLTIWPGQHHFDVIDPLKDPDSDLVRLLTT